MNVLLLTVFVGFVLVSFFVVFFFHQSATGSNERDALLPLAEEKPRTVEPPPGPSTLL